MSTLFRDPMKWVASAVGTKLRFAVTLAALALLVGIAVCDASQFGLRSAAGIALFIVWMQFLLLFGLRAMYLQAAKQDSA